MAKCNYQLLVYLLFFLVLQTWSFKSHIVAEVVSEAIHAVVVVLCWLLIQERVDVRLRLLLLSVGCFCYVLHRCAVATVELEDHLLLFVLLGLSLGNSFKQFLAFALEVSTYSLLLGC